MSNLRASGVQPHTVSGRSQNVRPVRSGLRAATRSSADRPTPKQAARKWRRALVRGRVSRQLQAIGRIVSRASRGGPLGAGCKHSWARACQVKQCPGGPTGASPSTPPPRRRQTLAHDTGTSRSQTGGHANGPPTPPILLAKRRRRRPPAAQFIAPPGLFRCVSRRAGWPAGTRASNFNWHQRGSVSAGAEGRELGLRGGHLGGGRTLFSPLQLSATLHWTWCIAHCTALCIALCIALCRLCAADCLPQTVCCSVRSAVCSARNTVCGTQCATRSHRSAPAVQ